MTFYYSHTAPMHRAGVIAVGHHVTSNMIIPPGAESYEILGDCSGQCTQQVSLSGVYVLNHIFMASIFNSFITPCTQVSPRS